jgi:hypothetical protein
MSNANSFADVILLQNQGKPLTLAATTTLHQSFQIGGAAAVLTVPNPMALIDTTDHFPGRSATGLSWIMRAAGLVTGGEQYQIEINQGVGPLGSIIASTGLQANGRTADNWLLEAECMWDSTSLFLRGIFWGWAGPNQVSQQALITVTQPANLAALQFNVSVLVASANPNALFTLTDFSADLS